MEKGPSECGARKEGRAIAEPWVSLRKLRHVESILRGRIGPCLGEERPSTLSLQLHRTVL